MGHTRVLQGSYTGLTRSGTLIVSLQIVYGGQTFLGRQTDLYSVATGTSSLRFTIHRKTPEISGLPCLFRHLSPTPTCTSTYLS